MEVVGSYITRTLEKPWVIVNMNKVILSGPIKDIKFSHKIGDVEYNKANIITKRENGKEDIHDVRFKKFSCNYNENDFVDLEACARSFSTMVDGKNKVDLYYFTYFDIPTTLNPDGSVPTNQFCVDGRICKINPLYTNKQGKHSIHFILANNIYSTDGSKKINSYLPMVALGKLAKEIEKLSVGDKIECCGECHSRYYKKRFDNGDYEFSVTHELFIKEFKKVE